MAGGGGGEESFRTVVPVVDLSEIDAVLKKSRDPGGEALAAALKKFRPADIGRDLTRRPVEEGRRLVEAGDDRYAAATLRAAHPLVAARVLALLAPERAARLLRYLPTDVQVAILGQLAGDERSRVDQALDAIAPADRKTVERLLSHPEGAVGRLMTPKVWACERDRTAGDALKVLDEKKEEIEVATNCYIVDAARKLVGVVPLRVLAVAPPAKPLAELMTPSPIALRETTDRADAAEIASTHNFLALPVVNAEGELAGAVTVDDLLDAALSKIGAGLLNQGGVAGKVVANVPYFQTTLLKVVRSRITWLVLLFLAETMTGTVLRHFEDALATVVTLGFFIPLLIGTGGNAGSQTVSTVIRALAIGEVRMGDVLRVVAKEASAGIVLGLLLGAIAFGRAQMWGVAEHDARLGVDPWQVALCVAATIAIVCVWANTVGALIPIAAQRVGIDPTVISGPLITTLVDATGLFIYLTIAHAMITQLAGR